MLKFRISDYQAIKKAEIDINGITVLSGPNGSGKSTIARWLYYYINVSGKFESLMTDVIRNHVKTVVMNMNNLFTSFDCQYGRDLCANMGKYIPQLSVEDKVFIYEAFAKLTDGLTRFLLEMPTKDRMRVLRHPRWMRDFSYLENTGRISQKSPWTRKIDMLSSLLTERLIDVVEHTEDAIKSKSVDELKQLISKEYLDSQSFPLSLIISENEESLLNDISFEGSQLFDNVCYVDTPFATTVQSYDRIWQDFQSMLKRDNSEMAPGAELVLRDIKSQTSVVVKVENDALGLGKELFFYENGKKIQLSLAATGVKAFAYISRLLENGILNSRSLLLIDEPESHLHPQWIVEFARVLVWLHKYVGVTVLIASHNPDMVSAIQSIAVREKVIDKTCFYLAEKEDNDSQYEYVNKKGDIGDIFSSFNIALERIEQYGCN